MNNIKVIVSGCGGVGSQLIGLLCQQKGVELVGVVDTAPDKVGKDAGIIAGRAPIGISITAQAQELYDRGADVALCTCAPTSAENTFALMRPALERGINVVVANMGTCDLWHTDPELAREVDALCKAHQVSYFGMGATQMQDRFILLNTEGCAKADKIVFTHFADIHAFRPESFRVEWGITLTEEEFYAGLESGTIEKHDYFANGITYIARRLGWNIDRVSSQQLPLVNGGKRVYGTHFTFVGYEGERARMETNWIFLLDEQHRYYDWVIVEGTPHIDSMNNFSPDRGLVSTYASLAHAIPLAVKSAPGYVSTLDLPACTLMDDALYLHI